MQTVRMQIFPFICGSIGHRRWIARSVSYEYSLLLGCKGMNSLRNLFFYFRFFVRCIILKGNQRTQHGEPKMPKTKNIKVGDVVHVNVTKLTNHDEAIRNFLTDWKTKMLDGRCIGIEGRPPPNGGTVSWSFIHV